MKKYIVSYSVVVPENYEKDLLINKVFENEGTVISWSLDEAEVSAEDLESYVGEWVEENIEEVVSNVYASDAKMKRSNDESHTFEYDSYSLEQEEDGKFLLTLDGYEISNYYWGDPSNGGEWAFDKTRAKCYVSITLDDQGISYTIAGIEYEDMY